MPLHGIKRRFICHTTISLSGTPTELTRFQKKNDDDIDCDEDDNYDNDNDNDDNNNNNDFYFKEGKYNFYIVRNDKGRRSRPASYRASWCFLPGQSPRH
jgi:hypothetical protein